MSPSTERRVPIYTPLKVVAWVLSEDRKNNGRLRMLKEK